MKKHYREENDCLNCGATLQGKFCHVCGQENLELKENFGHMMSHAISDYFHFDHLFFHTLQPLLFKPGKLTNEYMAGRRAQYLHPVKMYIFISIVYFLLLFQSGNKLVRVYEANPKPANKEINKKPPTKGIATKQAQSKQADAKDIDSAKKEIAANPYIPNAAKKEIEKNLDKNKTEKINGTGNSTVESGSVKWFKPTTEDTSYNQYLLNQEKLPEDNKDGFLKRQWNKKVFSYRARYGPGAIEQFTDELKHNVPKMMFLLLPLVALILRVAFWKNKKYYVEYIIYTLHLFCFLFLFLGILILIKLMLPDSWKFLNDWIILFEMGYIFWYIYRSLRVVYQRNRFRTITKLIGVSLMYSFVFTFCLIALFLVTTII